MIPRAADYHTASDQDLIAQALHVYTLGPEQRAMLAQALAARLHARMSRPARVVKPTTTEPQQLVGEKWE